MPQYDMLTPRNDMEQVDEEEEAAQQQLHEDG